MNNKIYRYCPPKKKKKRCNNYKKMGLILLLLGAVSVFALILPLKYWVLLLSIVLVACGIILIKD